MRIGIYGRKQDTSNYENFLAGQGVFAVTTLNMGEAALYDAVLLPGGGDIAPVFFGEPNLGSCGIDPELDTIQLAAARYCVKNHVPLLGICKGMQVINVALGGTLIQNLSTASLHRCAGKDLFHPVCAVPGTFLESLYGTRMTVNSAHHQGIGKLGVGLLPVQRCPFDGCIEAIVHEVLPIAGVQWHPERLGQPAGAAGVPLLRWFLSQLSS